MSVKVMSMVWDHYPEGGGEKLVALALADEADHDGNNIYPSIKRLAQRCNMGERTVQYNLRKIESRTFNSIPWLELVSGERGGKGVTRRYRIPIDKLSDVPRGTVQDLHPLEEGKGCNGLHPIEDERAQEPHPLKGAKSAPYAAEGCNLTHQRVQPVAPDPLYPTDTRTDARAPARGKPEAFGDVVAYLTERGTPWHFCTGERDRHRILAWLKAGVTYADLDTAIARASEHKQDGPLGPSYLDPVVRQVLTERTSEHTKRPEGASHDPDRKRDFREGATDPETIEWAET